MCLIKKVLHPLYNLDGAKAEGFQTLKYEDIRLEYIHLIDLCRT
jgi:hypothetical protein